jgi:hypothetical protein
MVTIAWPARQIKTEFLLQRALDCVFLMFLGMNECYFSKQH